MFVFVKIKSVSTPPTSKRPHAPAVSEVAVLSKPTKCDLQEAEAGRQAGAKENRDGFAASFIVDCETLSPSYTAILP